GWKTTRLPEVLTGAVAGHPGVTASENFGLVQVSEFIYQVWQTLEHVFADDCRRRKREKRDPDGGEHSRRESFQIPPRYPYAKSGLWAIIALRRSEGSAHLQPVGRNFARGYSAEVTT